MSEKIKISAVICELNPLHFGHKMLFDRAKENSDALICVMSGNFVQRGEPAIIDKWSRTELALKNGADMVIELPLPWACAGAERFAQGGVRLATALGNVDSLVFGSENDDLSLLAALCDALLSPEFSEKLQNADDGSTFARRRETALSEILGEKSAELLRSPNVILAVEYLKALKRENSDICPVVVKRQGAGHDKKSKGDEFRSAGELREMLRKAEDISGLVPESTLEALLKEKEAGGTPTDISYLERAILCKLRQLLPETLSSLPDVSEGLENRLYSAIQKARSLEELYSLTKSKRYTHARIRRLVLHAFLGLNSSLPESPPYIRILGMSCVGERVLREAAPSLPVAVRPADFRLLSSSAQKVFELEAKADDVYALSSPVPRPCGRDYTEKLRKL